MKYQVLLVCLRINNISKCHLLHILGDDLRVNTKVKLLYGNYETNLIFSIEIQKEFP